MIKTSVDLAEQVRQIVNQIGSNAIPHATA